MKNIFYKIFIAAVIIILFFSNALFIFKYFSLKKGWQNAVVSQKSNSSVLNFTKLFMSKVLNAQQEVSFEDRLMLENAVRDTRDSALLQRWNSFVEAESQAEAQTSAKKLLEMLINKIQ